MTIIIDHSRKNYPFVWNYDNNTSDTLTITKICAEYSRTGRMAPFIVKYNNQQVNPLSPVFTPLQLILAQLNQSGYSNITFEAKHFKTLKYYDHLASNPTFLLNNADKILYQTIPPITLLKYLRAIREKINPKITNTHIASYKGKQYCAGTIRGKDYLLIPEKDYQYNAPHVKIGIDGWKLYCIPYSNLERINQRKIDIKLSNQLNLKAIVNGVIYKTPRDKRVLAQLKANSYGSGRNAIYMLPTKIPKDLELLNGTPLFSPVPEIKNKLNTYGYITTLKQCPVAQSKMFFTDEIDLLPQAWWDHAKNIPVTVYISKDLIRLHSAPNKHKDFPLKKETLDKYNGCSVMMPRMIIIDNDNANTHNIAPLHITIDNTPIQQAQTNTQPTQARPKIRQQR